MHPPTAEVIASGINVVDFLARPPAGVVAGGKYETPEMEVQGGGPASTAACVTAVFGHATAFLARLGDDPISRLSRSQFAQAGILPDHLIMAPGERAGVSMIQIDRASGERTVFYNLHDYGWIRDEDIPLAAIKEARLVIVDGYDTTAALGMLRAAASISCPSIIDLEHGETGFVHECISLASDVLLPLHTARATTGQDTPEAALRALAEIGTGQMLVTDGDRGSWALTPDGILHQPAFETRVVDTNGCGDAFHGGYAVGLLRGWPLPLRMEFAAWVASRVATALGGRSGIPDRATLRNELHRFSPALQAAASSLP
ncbi:carbohydrate kinase family protein [Luteolibacter marinus]|uniref:carbohydrate kinase family protein n=1 Tax=Luteolibacter marinus TaxID=2776705 RepID=UPI00186732C0|nr:PfkB family carbohydrate kinase [Luteolibacter marinus]